MKQNCLCYCFMIMEIFSKEYIETDREGIDFGLKYLNKVLNPRPVDAFLDAKLTICCISYLWQCIKLNDDNLKHFVSSKGVYLLLDIIEVKENVSLILETFYKACGFYLTEMCVARYIWERRFFAFLASFLHFFTY